MYRDRTSGKEYTQAKIDRLTRIAKRELFEDQLERFNYNFCEKCKRNKNNTILDPSHNKSVKKCKDDGDIELIFNKKNMQILCRNCHKIKDGLDLQFTK